jgi:uncharacterized surface protein with fasciclin (FAS1) repeats
VTTRTKTLGVAAAIAAIALSIPTSVTALAEPTPTPTAPVAPIPDVQGPDCGTYKETLTAAGSSPATLFKQTASAAIASIPELSTFSRAISGQVNPAVNIVSVLDGGPYNVFAPTDEAFAKLDPGTMEALKNDPAALTDILYYHIALGYLGADDIAGKLTSQQGAQLTITGSGGDIKVDDVAKVVCGNITAQSAKIYLIDTVLDPANALPSNATTTTSPTTTSETTTPTSPTDTISPTETTPPVPTESLPAEATPTTIAPAAPA